MIRSLDVVVPVVRLDALLFELAEQRCAVPLTCVIELTRACSVQALPSAPGFVLGVLNLRGSVLPVLDLRRRFGFAETPLDPNDYFVIAHAAERRVALRVDRPLGIESLPSVSTAAAPNLTTGTEFLSGVAAVADGVVLIYDLASFLSNSEAAVLDRALASAGSPGEQQP